MVRLYFYFRKKQQGGTKGRLSGVLSSAIISVLYFFGIFFTGDFDMRKHTILAVLIVIVAAVSAVTARAEDGFVEGLIVRQDASWINVPGAVLQKGDLLESWESVQADRNKVFLGYFSDIFDWWELYREWGPRGAVTLTVIRDGAETEVKMPSGDWDVSLVPVGAEEYLEYFEVLPETPEKMPAISEDEDAGTRFWFFYDLGRFYRSKNRLPEARDALKKALGIAAEEKRCSAVSQAVIELAKCLEEQQEFDAADRIYAETGEECGRVENLSISRAFILRNAAISLWNRSRFSESEKLINEERNIWLELCPGSIGYGDCLLNLGVLNASVNNSSAAERFMLDALGIYEQTAPSTLKIAEVYNNLGIVAADRGDFAAAEEYYLKSLAIKDIHEPGGLGSAMTLNNLGIIAWKRGNIDKTEEYFLLAKDIRERLAPGKFEYAQSLGNLGLIYKNKGDFALAQEYYEGAMKLMRKLSPGSVSLAINLNNLGSLAFSRGMFFDAEGYFMEFLKIVESLAPDSVEMAAVLNNLGSLASVRTDIEAAKGFYLKALDIGGRKIPGTVELSTFYLNYGNFLFSIGENDEAAEYLKKSVEIRREAAPGSLQEAAALAFLGVIEMGSGNTNEAELLFSEALGTATAKLSGGIDEARIRMNYADLCITKGMLPSAEEHLVRALEIISSITPGTVDEVKILRLKARLHRLKNEPEHSLELLYKAAEAFEEQLRNLGGKSEARAGFSAGFSDIYRELVDILVETGRYEEAFTVMERSRARILLQTLAERDLVFSADIPEELDSGRRMLSVRYQKLMDAAAKAEDEKELAGLKIEIEAVRSEMNALKKEIIEASPRLASLRYPETLNIQQAVETLDNETVMLAYSVGEEKSFLFVAGKENNVFEVMTIPAGSPEIGRKVRMLRQAIQEQRDIRPAAEGLSDLLLMPAARHIAKSSRLLILPDGPLHFLPFDVLSCPGTGRFRYLMEKKPVHYAASATVYRELKQMPPPEMKGRVTAMGDPYYGAERVGGCVHSALRNEIVAPLPSSGDEVRNIGKVFPGSSSFLGREASEEVAKSEAGNAAILHFACHGFVNEAQPLESGLLLSVPAEGSEENGFLQAWEVFEGMRMNAELVTLSACESALGRELGGEGILGITRAFQYSGARMVLSSLWQVSDASTSELMTRFYQFHGKGMRADSALRRAKMTLLKKPLIIKNEKGSKSKLDASHPFYWAAFSLYGYAD